MPFVSRSRMLELLLLALSSLGASSSFTFESRGMRLRRELVGSGLGPIWAMAFLPDGQLLMTIKTGGLKRYDPQRQSFRDIPGAPAAAVMGQGGLLDIALSPEFATDHRVYLSYSKEVGKDAYTTALGVGEFDGKALHRFREIFVAQGSSGRGEHFGGRILVETSALWLSVGERGERENAQKLSNHLGKILRLTRDGQAHPDNPFRDRKDARPEIFSYGHRNPQGLVRHPLTGEIWEHEHGPRGGDEINIIKRGANYGWPKATFGREYWGPAIGLPQLAGTEAPIHQWTPSIAPCGMIIYSGRALPGWKNLLLSGALVKTHLNLMEFRQNRMVAEERLFAADGQRVREVEEGPDGAVWYATDDGSLFRIQKI